MNIVSKYKSKSLSTVRLSNTVVMFVTGVNVASSATETAKDGVLVTASAIETIEDYVSITIEGDTLETAVSLS